MKIILIMAAALVVLAIPCLVYLFMSLVSAFARVKRGGPGQAREFSRARVGARRFFGASVEKQDNGSLISTRAGISLRGSPQGLRVKETRTIAKDVF